MSKNVLRLTYLSIDSPSLLYNGFLNEWLGLLTEAPTCSNMLLGYPEFSLLLQLHTATEVASMCGYMCRLLHNRRGTCSDNVGDLLLRTEVASSSFWKF